MASTAAWTTVGLTLALALGACGRVDFQTRRAHDASLDAPAAGDATDGGEHGDATDSGEHGDATDSGVDGDATDSGEDSDATDSGVDGDATDGDRPDAPTCACLADLDGDEWVRMTDYIVFQACFGTDPTGECADADFNCDGRIDPCDFAIFQCQNGPSGSTVAEATARNCCGLLGAGTGTPVRCGACVTSHPDAGPTCSLNTEDGCGGSGSSYLGDDAACP